MMTPFEDILQHLSQVLGITLHIDAHGACVLQLADSLKVQIEPHRDGQHLVLATYIGEINPGRYREEFLKSTLKANDAALREGNAEAILGFSARHNKLACHTLLPLMNLTIDRVINAIASLSTCAMNWGETLAAGQTAPRGMARPPGSLPRGGIRP